jgi:hypothetical protein
MSISGSPTFATASTDGLMALLSVTLLFMLLTWQKSVKHFKFKDQPSGVGHWPLPMILSEEKMSISTLEEAAGQA